MLFTSPSGSSPVSRTSTIFSPVKQESGVDLPVTKE